jgi:hypothetical protein
VSSLSFKPYGSFNISPDDFSPSPPVTEAGPWPVKAPCRGDKNPAKPPDKATINHNRPLFNMKNRRPCGSRRAAFATGSWPGFLFFCFTGHSSIFNLEL